MNDNVIPIGGVTKLDIPADQVLEGAKGKLDKVIVIGWTKGAEGDEYGEDEFFACSMADGGDALWLIERFKKALLETPERED